MGDVCHELPLAVQVGLQRFGFNLGIESMQLAVIACVMPWLLILSRTPAYGAVRPVGAGFGAVAALAWTIERVSGGPNPIARIIESGCQHPGWALAFLAITALTAAAIGRL